MLAVSQQERPSSPMSSLGSFTWPILVGLALSTAFYALIFRGPFHVPFALRYFTGHPVLYVEVILFFMGLAALGFKLLEVSGQQGTLKAELFDPPRPGGQPASDALRLLEAWGEFPAALRRSYLGRRIEAVLEFVARKGSAAGLEEELRVLSDQDLDRQSDSYSLARIIIWATPMLGFLGTVVGITQALGDLATQDLEGNGLQTAMKGLLAGLYVAFDTTALALTLSMVLMFVQYGIEQLDSHLLRGVDERMEAEMIGRFELVGTSSDPHVASVQHMAHTVLRATEHLVEKQAEIWQATLHSSHQQWGQLLQLSGEQVRTSLGESLDASLRRHAAQLAESEQAAAAAARQQWQQWQEVLLENSRTLLALQSSLHQQGETLQEVVRATGDVVTLEKSLNENLKLLAGAKNFENTVMSLSAAIHLLNTRLEPAELSRVELKTGRGRAA